MSMVPDDSSESKYICTGKLLLSLCVYSLCLSPGRFPAARGGRAGVRGGGADRGRGGRGDYGRGGRGDNGRGGGRGGGGTISTFRK